jgi:hypothetical protein
VFETETFRLHVVDRPDPYEVLGWIQKGSVRLRLPIPRREVHLGPLSFHIASTAVLELEVDDGSINRATAQGRLDPPIRLPLGFEAERIHLSPRGDLLLGISRLPDVNLSSLVSWLPRVPDKLRDLGQQLRGRSAPGTAGDRDPSPAGAAETAAPRRPFEVEARRVRPLPGVLVDLGPAGRLELDPASELDVRYADGRLTCTGTVVFDGGRLTGPQFEVENLRSSSRVRWERGESLEFEDLVAHADHLEWTHEREWRLDDVELRSARVAHNRRDGHLEGELELVGRADDPRPVAIRIVLGDGGIARVERDAPSP